MQLAPDDGRLRTLGRERHERLRGSATWPQEVSAMRRRRSAKESSRAPVLEESRPPSNAAVNFRRATAGKAKVIWISCVMAGVAPASDAHQDDLDTHSLC